MSTEPRRALVIGASSGIGAALAERLALEGYDTALVARSADKLALVCARIKQSGAPGVPSPYPHDVRRLEQVPALFERIVEDLHGLDVCVYAAGVLPAVELDEYDTAKDRDVMEINALGAIAWLNEAARWFGVARRGSLVGISSMAGERGRRGYPAYGASKAALNSFLESLRNRLSQRGVCVLTVKPGFVRTQMLEGRSGLFWVISPEQAAAQIYRAIRRGKQTVFVSPRWRLVSLAIRLLPSVVFRRLAF